MSCDANQQFGVQINFNHQDASDQFTLIADGAVVGTFRYANLPILVGPYDGTGDEIQFEVIDSTDPECSLQGNVESPICRPPCDLTALSIRQNGCDSEGNFSFELSFFQNFASDSFSLELVGANGFLTNYSYLCLLYTSPSPRDRQKSRMPSSA